MSHEEKRAVIGVSEENRNRLNMACALLGAVEQKKMSQSNALGWLLDRYEEDIGQTMAVAALRVQTK